MLRRGRYFIESAYPELLRALTLIPTIAAARVQPMPTERTGDGAVRHTSCDPHPFPVVHMCSTVARCPDHRKWTQH